MFKIITISTAVFATISVIATAAICSFCSCAHSTPEVNKEVTTQFDVENQQNTEASFYKPFGLDLADDSQRAYMMYIDVYDEEGNIEKSFEPIVRDSGTYCK